MSFDDEHPQLAKGLILAVMGAGLTLLFANMQGGLFAFIIRDTGIAIGMALAAIGVVVAVTRSDNPFTPRRAWALPLGVSLGAGLMVVIEAHYPNGVGLGDAFWSPDKGWLLAASIGAPLGSAIKHRRSIHVLVAITTMAGVVLLSAALASIPVTKLTNPFWIGFVGVPALLSTITGYALSPPRERYHAEIGS